MALKGAMVSNAALAALCVSCGLHRHLHLDSYTLATTFETYARQLEAKRLEAEAAAEDSLPRQHWLQVEPPKVVEQIMGRRQHIDMQLLGTLGHRGVHHRGPLRFRRFHVRWSREVFQESAPAIL